MQNIMSYKKANDESIIDKEDRKISYFIISYYYVQILNLALKTILPIPVSLYSQISILFGMILVVFFIRSILIVLKRSLVLFMFIEFLFLGMFLISLLMGNAEASLLINNMVWVLFICTPLGMYIYSIKDTKVFYNLFMKNSVIMTLILFLMFFFPNDDINYNMSFSYALLVPTIFHINEWFNNKKKILLILSIVEVLGILLYGSRGPLLSIVFFIIIKFIINEKITIKKIFITLFAIITTIGLYFNFNKIGVTVLKFLAKKDYYSRTLILMFSNSISDDSGRFDIFNYYLDLIGQKPITGWGLLGGWLGKGEGPHNMLIEIILAFGVIIGGILVAFLLVSQLRVFFVKDKTRRDLILIYMSICIVLYFISGDFLQNPNFFIFLGLLLGSIEDKSAFKIKYK